VYQDEVAMHWTYSCPHCRAMLNPDETIILLAEVEDRHLLVGFHPQPGNYQVYLPPGCHMVAGSRWQLSCPVCRQSLVTELSDDLCALDVHIGSDTHRVYFSRIAGEQATFMVTAEGLLKDYGIHTDRYLEHLVHLKYMR
jgi:hypothetical protein